MVCKLLPSWVTSRISALGLVTTLACAVTLVHGVGTTAARGEESARSRHWVWSTAHVIPPETTSEQSGYSSMVEGFNAKIYIGTTKYGDNAYLVEFDPIRKQMKVVLDAEKEIGVDHKRFAAHTKFYTRNNIGSSGIIYLGSKQGYTQKGEKATDYLGEHRMVFDPRTGQTRVDAIPIPHQGIISVTPDEARGVAYISTCSDERPIECTHFMFLDLKSGQYRDLLDCRHIHAFIVVDYLGRAYHPVLGKALATPWLNMPYQTTWNWPPPLPPPPGRPIHSQ